MKTKNMIICGIFAAVMCIFSVITIPIGPVPVTLSLFGAMLVSNILGFKKSVVVMVVYIALGFVGLPVFSGFKGGAGVLFGATGGYIWSYVFVAVIVGLYSDKVKIKSKKIYILLLFITELSAVSICYICGCLQYSAFSSVSFIDALSVCVVPFVPFDILKSVASICISESIKKANII